LNTITCGACMYGTDTYQDANTKTCEPPHGHPMRGIKPQTHNKFFRAGTERQKKEARKRKRANEPTAHKSHNTGGRFRNAD